MQSLKKWLFPAAVVLILAAAGFALRMSRGSETRAPASVHSAGHVTPAQNAQSAPAQAASPSAPVTAPAAPAPAARAIADVAIPAGKETGLDAFFASLNESNAVVYTVQPKDTLTRISGLYGVTTGVIMRASGLKDANKLQVGMKLRIPKEPFSAIVDKTSNMLYLMAGERLVKTYRVGTGKGDSTPVGRFKILNKLVNPTWYYDGKVVPYGAPDNPLGTRWMGFDAKGYGLHGTTEPDSIGKSESLGCVRMLNSDVEELYELLPRNAMVHIVEGAGNSR